MHDDALIAAAKNILSRAQAQGLRLVTAESCTGGLIAATIARVPGCSGVLERGLVTYSNEAKSTLLGVPAELIARRGAVSQEVALAMAEGALAASPADLSVAVTGIAGPGGGSAEKPVGLVHISAARRGGARLHEERRFGEIGREAVQHAATLAALGLLLRLID